MEDWLRGERDWNDIDNMFFCRNDKFKKDVIKYRGKGFYHKDFEKIMTELINADREIEIGNIEYLQKRADVIADLNPLVGCINNERKVDLLKRIIKSCVVGESTLFLMKMSAYGTLEEYDEDGNTLTELCLGGNKPTTIYNATAESDILLEKMLGNDGGYKTIQIMKAELEIIKEKMQKNEAVRIYRGFAIEKDERVREGYKKDGEKYFKQRAGTGISYSLDRNVAGYFAMRKLMMKDGDFIEGGNFYSGLVFAKMKTQQAGNVISQDEYIKERTKDISSMREQRGLIPIICEYLLEPEKVKGWFLNIGESEIMSLPEDVLVKHYEIAHSRDIASCEYEFINKGISLITEIAGGLIEGGLVCWISGGSYGKVYAIFAKAEDVKSDAEKFEKKFFGALTRTDKCIAFNDFSRAMEYYALSIPEEVAPTNHKMTKELSDYLRKPYDYKREQGKKYRVGTVKQ